MPMPQLKCSECGNPVPVYGGRIQRTRDHKSLTPWVRAHTKSGIVVTDAAAADQALCPGSFTQAKVHIKKAFS